MENRQFNLLDLGAPEMQPAYAIHFATDDHINRAGHRFVADALYAWVSDRFSGTTSGGEKQMVISNQHNESTDKW